MMLMYYVQARSSRKLLDGIRNMLEVRINWSKMSPRCIVHALLQSILLYGKSQSIIHFLSKYVVYMYKNNHVELVAFIWKENNGSIAALHSNHLSMLFSIVVMESTSLFASYLVSSVSFGVNHLGQCSQSEY